MPDRDRKTETPTPPVRPHDTGDETGAPEHVEVEAPRSTDAEGKAVPLPDLGGTID